MYHCAGLGQKVSSTIEGIWGGHPLFFHLRLRWESISTALDDLLGNKVYGVAFGSVGLLRLLSPFLRYARFIIRLIIGYTVLEWRVHAPI